LSTYFVNPVNEIAKTIVKTPEQIEFAEIFERLERDFQISKADVARALTVERSYVSMLIKGQRTPHLRMLQAMRDFEKRLQAGRETAPPAVSDEDEVNRLYHQIVAMKQHDPSNFEVVKKVIETLAPASSKTASGAGRLLKKVSDAVQNDVLK